MDDFYYRMIKIIIAVPRHSPSLTSEWRQDGVRVAQEWRRSGVAVAVQFRVAVQCQSGGLKSEWQSDVRVAVLCQSGDMMSEWWPDGCWQSGALVTEWRPDVRLLARYQCESLSYVGVNSKLRFGIKIFIMQVMLMMKVMMTMTMVVMVKMMMFTRL